MPLPLFVCGCGRLCGHIQLQPNLVGNQGNELTVGGLALADAHRVPKVLLQDIQVTSVPGHFDSVADSPFHPAGGGVEGLGNRRVQNLGDSLDQGLVLHTQDNCLTQVVVTLDVSRDTDVVDDLGDSPGQVRLLTVFLRLLDFSQKFHAVFLQLLHAAPVRGTAKSALGTDF